MQVFGGWLSEWLHQQDKALEEVRQHMKEAYAEAERRHKETLVAQMLAEAERIEGGQEESD